MLQIVDEDLIGSKCIWSQEVNLWSPIEYKRTTTKSPVISQAKASNPSSIHNDKGARK